MRDGVSVCVGVQAQRMKGRKGTQHTAQHSTAQHRGPPSWMAKTMKIKTCREATEMSAASTATPAGSVKRLMIGSRAYVASAGASSVIVYRILSLVAAVDEIARVHVAAAETDDDGTRRAAAARNWRASILCSCVR